MFIVTLEIATPSGVEIKLAVIRDELLATSAMASCLESDGRWNVGQITRMLNRIKIHPLTNHPIMRGNAWFANRSIASIS